MGLLVRHVLVRDREGRDHEGHGRDRHVRRIFHRVCGEEVGHGGQRGGAQEIQCLGLVVWVSAREGPRRMVVVAKGREPGGEGEVREAVVGLGDLLRGELEGNREVEGNREGDRAGCGGHGLHEVVRLGEMGPHVHGHAQSPRALVVVDHVFRREDHGHDREDRDRDLFLFEVHRRDPKLQPSGRRMGRHPRCPRAREDHGFAERTWIGYSGLGDWR